MTKPIAVALFLALACPAIADEADSQDQAKAVAPFLDELTIAVAHVDLARLNVDAVLDRIAEQHKGNAKDLAELRRELAARAKQLAQVSKDAYVVVSLADLPMQPPFLVLPVAGGTDAKAAAQQLSQEKRLAPLHFQVFGSAVVGGSEPTLQRLRNVKPVARAELARAIAAAQPGTVQVAVLFSADMRRVVESVYPKLPQELGDGASQVVTRGVQWVAIGVETTPKLSVHVVIQGSDAASAKALEQFLTKVLQTVKQAPDVRRALPGLDQIVAQLTPELAEDRVLLKLDDKTLLGLLVPGLMRARESSARAQSMNNLKQIALAMHNYHDPHKAFPAVANFDKQGKPLLSWRVHLLPFVEGEALYKEFHLDEPWDSEHNKPLIARMPAVYRSPHSHAEAGKTTYLVPVGEHMVFTGGRKGMGIRDITDGTSNTIFVVEVDDAHAVPWTQPEDLKIDPQQPGAGLTSGMLDGFLATFADGSVRFIKKTIDPKTLNALFTRNGGEVIGEF